MDQLVFVGPGISTKDFKQNEFYKKFQKVFNQKPGLFSALAYESALALHQVIASGADTRGELRESLLNLKSFSGPFGKITISDKREFVRSLPIVKMENKALSRVFFHSLRKPRDLKGVTYWTYDYILLFELKFY